MREPCRGKATTPEPTDGCAGVWGCGKTTGARDDNGMPDWETTLGGSNEARSHHDADLTMRSEAACMLKGRLFDVAKGR